MIYKTLHIKQLKIEQYEPRMNSGTPEVLTVPAPLVAIVVLLLLQTW